VDADAIHGLVNASAIHAGILSTIISVITIQWRINAACAIIGIGSARIAIIANWQ
jgi:hypothetical protein